MERKTECEIVQDLLLGYVDGVLNAESKKLVEKHLSECEKCRNSRLRTNHENLQICAGLHDRVRKPYSVGAFLSGCRPDKNGLLHNMEL